jgi:hypothetical protein
MFCSEKRARGLVILRKQLLILALLAAIALAPVIKPVAAVPHIVTTPKWLTPTFSGTDSYHDTTVIAYEAGTTAKLLIRVYNDYATSSEIQIRVFMDWMTANVTSEEVTVAGGKYHTFEISIPIASVSEASNVYLHSYTIYFEYTTNTDPPVIIESVYSTGSNFAVYSADQADIVEITRQLDAMGFYSGIYVTAAARELLLKAGTEESLGAQTYDRGEFASSLTHYTNALNYTQTGISTDITKMTVIEDTVIGVLDSMKGSMSMMGYGSLLFGIGFLFIGIGVIIYSIRRPRPSA